MVRFSGPWFGRRRLPGVGREDSCTLFRLLPFAKKTVHSL